MSANKGVVKMNLVVKSTGTRTSPPEPGQNRRNRAKDRFCQKQLKFQPKRFTRYMEEEDVTFLMERHAAMAHTP